jgi:hypothetical protein
MMKMFCNKCQKEKDVSDFFEDNLCYKCQYVKKVLSSAAKTKIKRCRVCNKELSPFRRTLCSKECTDERKRQYDKERRLKNSVLSVYW